MVTPLSRRRVHKVARETVTLDLLSSGRLTLGVGLGASSHGEFEPFGEVTDPRERARLLDTGLENLARYWGGEFEPVPVQRPRIPVWVAGVWPNRRPVRRSARWDGLFAIGMNSPDGLAEMAAQARALRAADTPFDVITEIPPDDDPQRWGDAGATWVVTDFDRAPRESLVRDFIKHGWR